MEESSNEKNRVALINIIFLATIVISVLASFLPSEWLTGNPVLQILVSQILLVLPTAYFMFRTKTPYRQQVHLNKMKFSNIALSVLFGFLIRPLLTFVNGISMVFSANSTSSFMVDLSEQVPWYIGLLLVALLPCILEETVYRGVFYQEYRKVNPWRAVIFSGFLFGLMHGNLNQFCYAFVMGMIFALLIEATGSILSTMVLHFVLNAGSVIAIYILPKFYELAQEVYLMFQQNGQPEMAEVFELTLGDMSMTSSEWMHFMFSAEITPIPFWGVVAQFAPSAIVFSFLAFLVYRCIARRSGTWEQICTMYGNRSEQKESLLTVPMMLAIAIGVMSIFVYETLMRLPR